MTLKKVWTTKKWGKKTTNKMEVDSLHVSTIFCTCFSFIFSTNRITKIWFPHTIPHSFLDDVMWRLGEKACHVVESFFVFSWETLKEIFYWNFFDMNWKENRSTWLVEASSLGWMWLDGSVRSGRRGLLDIYQHILNKF